MAVSVVTAAVRAQTSVLAVLADAGIDATRDRGAVYPQPTAVLVDLPALVSRTQGGRVYEIPVFVISSDPLNSELTIDRLYALADDCAASLRINAYRPSSWQSSPGAQPLPAIELTATATATETEE